MIAKMTLILDACSKAKENLEKANANRDLLTVSVLMEAVEKQMIPLSALYDTLMGVELVSVEAPAPAPEPTPTSILEKYTVDLPPQYKHDCKNCTFLGQMGVYDLYYCPQSGNIPTVIARYGDKDSQYKSGIGSGDPDLQVAERRAKEAGLIK
jgi:hypothetical protein